MDMSNFWRTFDVDQLAAARADRVEPCCFSPPTVHARPGEVIE
jgi:hypothetical protein